MAFYGFPWFPWAWKIPGRIPGTWGQAGHKKRYGVAIVFAIAFLWFSLVFLRLGHERLWLFLWFWIGFPWLSYGFPMFSFGFFYDISSFLLCFYGIPCVS